MEIDLDSVYDQLEEITEWVMENDMAEVLHAGAELRSILDKISALHLRVVP